MIHGRRGKAARDGSRTLRLAIVAGGIMVVGASAVWWWTLRPAVSPKTSASPPAPTIPDSLAALEPFVAYQRALAFGQESRFFESLPYFRRALSDPPDAWQPYGAYAIALFQAVHQVRWHRGWAQPVTRSSFERTTLLEEAAVALDRAERLASNPKDRAYVITLRMKQLMAWGLDWDAYGEFTRAQRLDPSLGPTETDIGSRLRNPTTRAREP